MSVVINVVCGLLVAIVSGLILRKLDKFEKHAAKRELERDEREELTLESLNALFHVSKELVDSALYNKPPNGDMEEAYKYKQDVKHKLEAYIRKRASTS